MEQIGGTKPKTEMRCEDMCVSRLKNETAPSKINRAWLGQRFGHIVKPRLASRPSGTLSSVGTSDCDRTRKMENDKDARGWPGRDKRLSDTEVKKQPWQQ